MASSTVPRATSSSLAMRREEGSRWPGASRRSRMARRTCSPIWRCSGVGDAAIEDEAERGGLAEGTRHDWYSPDYRNWLFRLYLNVTMVRPAIAPEFLS